jgi:hypothetical protein
MISIAVPGPVPAKTSERLTNWPGDSNVDTGGEFIAPARRVGSFQEKGLDHNGSIRELDW